MISWQRSRTCARSRSRCAGTATAPTISCRRRWSRPGTTSNSFEQGTNLKAWLFTILRNAYFSELRKMKREVADSDGQLAARLSVPAEQQGHLDLIDLNNALGAPARRPARGADPGRRGRLLLRGRRHHFGLRRRHRQEPRQPCARQGSAELLAAPPPDGRHHRDRRQGARAAAPALARDILVLSDSLAS